MNTGLILVRDRIVGHAFTGTDVAFSTTVVIVIVASCSTIEDDHPCVANSFSCTFLASWVIITSLVSTFTMASLLD